MADYKIQLKRSAAREIDAIDSMEDRQRIVDRIGRLAVIPRPPGCQKLAGSNTYRVRQGRFRIIYVIEDVRLIVTVVKVAQRKDAYR
ncbi:MAG TPA: type II toxin-antitoxin system RelE/ParE family toxin [Rhodothermales bacterium]|nr:type II toxin-antitoxin system RelE/ParE family toxin [Rhodothermales bacterium]